MAYKLRSTTRNGLHQSKLIRNRSLIAIDIAVVMTITGIIIAATAAIYVKRTKKSKVVRRETSQYFETVGPDKMWLL